MHRHRWTCATPGPRRAAKLPSKLVYFFLFILTTHSFQNDISDAHKKAVFTCENTGCAQSFGPWDFLMLLTCATLLFKPSCTAVGIWNIISDQCASEIKLDRLYFYINFRLRFLSAISGREIVTPIQNYMRRLYNSFCVLYGAISHTTADIIVSSSFLHT